MAINARQAVAKSGKKATIKNPVPAALGVTNTVLTHSVKPAKPVKPQSKTHKTNIHKQQHNIAKGARKHGSKMTLM